jgi:hypothetical protein
MITLLPVFFKNGILKVNQEENEDKITASKRLPSLFKILISMTILQTNFPGTTHNVWASNALESLRLFSSKLVICIRSSFNSSDLLVNSLEWRR